MTQPIILLDTELRVYRPEQLGALLRDGNAAAALREACSATLTNFDGLDADARMFGTMIHVNSDFGLQPRYVLITKPAVPFLQGITLYVFPKWRGNGYAKALLGLIKNSLANSQPRIPFQAPVRAVDHPRLHRFYEQLGFKCAGVSTVDAHGEAYFDYFWYPGKFEVFIHDNGRPSIKIDPTAVE